MESRCAALRARRSRPREPNARRWSATMAGEVHLVPFRTQKLSPPAPMVLRSQSVGEQVVADQRRAFIAFAERAPAHVRGGPLCVGGACGRPTGPHGHTTRHAPTDGKCYSYGVICYIFVTLSDKVTQICRKIPLTLLPFLHGFVNCPKDSVKKYLRNVIFFSFRNRDGCLGTGHG